jgi:hypothetical protein
MRTRGHTLIIALALVFVGGALTETAHAGKLQAPKPGLRTELARKIRQMWQQRTDALKRSRAWQRVQQAWPARRLDRARMTLQRWRAQGNRRWLGRMTQRLRPEIRLHRARHHRSLIPRGVLNGRKPLRNLAHLLFGSHMRLDQIGASL